MKNMAVVTKGLDKAMASMNLEEVEKIMQKFESQFEDLDVREQVKNSDGVRNAVGRSDSRWRE